jgi:hypothetical protein
VFGHSSRTIGNPPRGKEASAAQEEAALFAVIDPKLFGVAIAARTNHTQRARRDMGREKGVGQATYGPAATNGGAPVQVASKIAALVLEACDFVLHQQLATFQFNDPEIVDRRMSAGFGYFRFQGAMSSFQVRKMRFYGHIGEVS